MSPETSLLVAQGVLSFIFGLFGGIKLANPAYISNNMPWAKRGKQWANWVEFIGRCEVLGAIGVIAPTLTGIQPWLAPLAALGLATIMILALLTANIPSLNFAGMVLDVLFLALAVYVVVGRWSLLAPMFPGKLLL